MITAAFVPGLRENVTLLRLLRLARVLRLVRILPELRVLVTSIWRSLPGVASLGVLGVLMLTLFVLLSMENLPTQIQQGLAVSSWTLVYFVSYVLVAAFLLVNILIGVVINSMEEAREIEWQREQRRRLGASTTEEDRRASIERRLHELRSAVESLEHELRRPPPE